MPAHLTRTLREHARRAGSRGVEVLILLQPGLEEAAKRRCARWLRRRVRGTRFYPALDLITARLREEPLRALARRSEVLAIEGAPTKEPRAVVERRRCRQPPLEAVVTPGSEAPRIEAERVPGEGDAASVAEAARPDPAADLYAWGIDDMRVPELWAAGALGDGVVVAHLDTGVDEDHVALEGRVAHRAVTRTDGQLASTTQMVDPDGHGTHTAGSICGQPFLGVWMGVAPGATLACATVMEGGDLTKRLLRGLQWVLDLKDDPEGPVDIRVLNLSLGFKGWELCFRPVLQKIQAAGILTVACVGNDGRDTSRSPGNYRETLAVGAYDQEDRVWSGSSSNTWSTGRFVPDLVAPGVDIPSARAGTTNGYETRRGTSMATAYVSGLAALLFSKHPSARPEEVKQAILNGCWTLDGVAESRQGYGWPDAVEAMKALDNIIERKV